MASKLDRYIASMVLSGVGDALGYYNGDFEFCHSGRAIHDEVKKMGGLDKIKVALPKWMISDDTVMNLATSEALTEHGANTNKEELFIKIAEKYKKCTHDMGGRAPGATSMGSIHKLKTTIRGGYQIPFNPRGGGCGAAMRAMCIGLRYPRPEDLSDLIAVSVESGRMTHHHPTGYLGSLASALFVSYAIHGKPVKEWGSCLLSVLPETLKYVESQGRYVEENKEAWQYFTDKWTKYLTLRGISDGTSEPKFSPDDLSIEKRDALYKSFSFGGWGGASGHDAPMIAYDAVLGAGDSWAELCSRGMFHSGDSDSTGVIAAACFGAMYGFHGVSKNNHKHLEYRQRLATQGELLYHLANPEESPGKLASEEDAKAASVQDKATEDQAKKVPDKEHKRAAAAAVEDMVEKVSAQSDQ